MLNVLLFTLAPAFSVCVPKVLFSLSLHSWRAATVCLHRLWWVDVYNSAKRWSPEACPVQATKQSVSVSSPASYRQGELFFDAPDKRVKWHLPPRSPTFLQVLEHLQFPLIQGCQIPMDQKTWYLNGILGQRSLTQGAELRTDLG